MDMESGNFHLFSIIWCLSQYFHGNKFHGITIQPLQFLRKLEFQFSPLPRNWIQWKILHRLWVQIGLSPCTFFLIKRISTGGVNFPLWGLTLPILLEGGWWYHVAITRWYLTRSLLFHHLVFWLEPKDGKHIIFKVEI